MSMRAVRLLGVVVPLPPNRCAVDIPIRSVLDRSSPRQVAGAIVRPHTVKVSCLPGPYATEGREHQAMYLSSDLAAVHLYANTKVAVMVKSFSQTARSLAPVTDRGPDMTVVASGIAWEFRNRSQVAHEELPDTVSTL